RGGSPALFVPHRCRPGERRPVRLHGDSRLSRVRRFLETIGLPRGDHSPPVPAFAPLNLTPEMRVPAFARFSLVNAGRRNWRQLTWTVEATWACHGAQSGGPEIAAHVGLPGITGGTPALLVPGGLPELQFVAARRDEGSLHPASRLRTGTDRQAV